MKSKYPVWSIIDLSERFFNQDALEQEVIKLEKHYLIFL